jgi:hypothetical protein
MAAQRGKRLMLDLAKLSELADRFLKTPLSPNSYLCGPNTFKDLLLHFKLIPANQKTFVLDAGTFHFTVIISSLVPDNGKFYPCFDEPPRALPLPRSF